MYPVMEGLTIPGMVPMVLEMPMRMAAYCGAMSRWLMEKPAQAKPPHPSDNEMQVMAAPRVISSAVRDMNSVWHAYDPQVNSFRTCEDVDLIMRLISDF